MTTFQVPTFVTYPATGPTVAARGQKFMLPGYAGEEGGVAWTDTWVDTFGKTHARDIGDVFHYWFKHWAGVSYIASPTSPYYTPMSSGLEGSPNTILMQPDETYVFDYGFKWGGDTQAVAGGQGMNLSGFYTLISGARLFVEWPGTALYLTANLILDLNGSALVQADNQPYDKPVLTLLSVATRGSASLTNVTVPDLSADGISTADLLGDEVQLRVPTWDPSLGGDGGGWVFSGDVVAGTNTITNVNDKYADRPLSTDWEFHAIQQLNTLPFVPNPPGAIISDVTGTTITVVRSDNSEPFLSTVTGRVQFALDDQSAWPGKATILSITPESPGLNRTVLLDKTSPWNWGVAGPRAEIERSLTTVEPRRRNGTWLMATAESLNCQVKNGEMRMGKPNNASGTFTPHESWYMFLFSRCSGFTVGDPTGATTLTLRNAWSDAFNFSGIPYDTEIAYVDVRPSNPGGNSTGRHMFTLEGESGLYVHHSAFHMPARWMFDTEDGDRMLDHTFENCAFGTRFGLFHIRPGSVITPAPCFLDGCDTVEDDDEITITRVRALWPVNPGDVHGINGSGTPSLTGFLNSDAHGAIVTGPGIPDHTYITRVLSGTRAKLSKPATSTENDVELIKGQAATVRGMRLYDCTFTEDIDIWFHGAPSGKGELWFQGDIVDGSKLVSNVTFPARPDGSPTPTLADIAPSLGRTFCVYAGIFSGTGHRVVVASFPVGGTSFMASTNARQTGRFWFYSENIPTWFSDFKVVRCTGPGVWTGQHFSDTATATPMIMLPHLCSDVEVTDNVCVARPAGGGGAIEQMVGTTRAADSPMWPPPAVFGPKLTGGGLKSPPWSPGDPAWTVERNRWTNATDNQVTTTVGVWLHTLDLDADLDAAGSGATPPEYSMLTTDPITITAELLASDLTDVPGIVVFLVNGAEVGTAPIVSDVAEITLPAGHFTNGVYALSARYDGNVDGTSFYIATAYRSTLPPAAGWTANNLTVGTPVTPTPTVPDIEIEISVNPATVNQSVTITVVLVGQDEDHPPEGPVQIRSDAGSVLHVGVPNEDGEVVWQQTFTPGERYISAEFLGDTYNLPVASEPELLEVTVPSGIEITVGAVKS